MPLSLNPNVQLDYVLKSDRDLEDKQPTFKLKILTDELYGEFHKLLKVFKSQSDEEEDPSALADVVFYGVAGWENMGKDYSKDAMREILTVAELAELLHEILTLNELRAKEKKE